MKAKEFKTLLEGMNIQDLITELRELRRSTGASPSSDLYDVFLDAEAMLIEVGNALRGRPVTLEVRTK